MRAVTKLTGYICPAGALKRFIYLYSSVRCAYSAGPGSNAHQSRVTVGTRHLTGRIPDTQKMQLV